MRENKIKNDLEGKEKKKVEEYKVVEKPVYRQEHVAGTKEHKEFDRLTPEEERNPQVAVLVRDSEGEKNLIEHRDKLLGENEVWVDEKGEKGEFSYQRKHTQEEIEKKRVEREKKWKELAE